MNSGATPMSLTDKARRLAALARTKRESESDVQDQLRLQGQVSKLAVEIRALNSVLDIHRALAVVGVPVPELPDLRTAPAQLRQEVDRIGRPNWQYLSARVTSLAKLHSKVAEADGVAWSAWADNEIARLPLELMPRLGDQRSDGEARVASLERLARKPPTASSPAEFRMLWRRVNDDLNSVESSGVDAVLARFVDGRIRMSELSEEELELLRSDESIRGQLYLSLS